MPGGVAGGGLPPVRSSWKLSQALQCVGTSTQINDRKSFWFAGAGVPVGVPGGAVDCRRAGRASCLDSSRAAAAGRLLSLAVPDRCRRWVVSAWGSAYIIAKPAALCGRVFAS